MFMRPIHNYNSNLKKELSTWRLEGNFTKKDNTNVLITNAYVGFRQNAYSLP